jgi:FkbM family methyltransferase
MRRYSYRPHDQYFEQFLALRSGPVFIDCGAFQGETSLEFAKRYPDYAAIHAFEPSSTNTNAILQQTSELHDLILHSVGLSDVSASVRFSADLGSASRASEDGDTLIEVIPLDDLELSQADLIKMDLEGGEMKALQGSEKTIRLCSPALAIAAYHDPKDFSLLHQTMKKMLPNHRFYLRHYTSGWAETILYCVPG